MFERDALWELRLFAEVVEAGSIAAAARSLRITPGAVSKRIGALEARLGARLLQRTTRRLRVTREGAELKERAAHVFEALEAAENSVQRGAGALNGVVRVSAPSLLGQELIAPRLAEFCLKNPTVQIELETSDRFIDLLAEPVDIAIRVAARLPSSGLSARKLAELQWKLVARETYLETHGVPRRPDELESHNVLESMHAAERGHLTLRRGSKTWRPRVKGQLIASGLSSLRHAVLGGLGIAAFPSWFIADEVKKGVLREVLGSYRLQTRTVWLLQPSRAFVAPRVRAVIDALLVKPLIQS